MLSYKRLKVCIESLTRIPHSISPLLLSIFYTSWSTSTYIYVYYCNVLSGQKNTKFTQNKWWEGGGGSFPRQCGAGIVHLIIVTKSIVNTSHYSLAKKESKFPRNNLKCRGKRDTTWNIPRCIISCSIAENRKSTTFGTDGMKIITYLRHEPFHFFW